MLSFFTNDLGNKNVLTLFKRYGEIGLINDNPWLSIESKYNKTHNEDIVKPKNPNIHEKMKIIILNKFKELLKDKEFETRYFPWLIVLDLNQINF